MSKKQPSSVPSHNQPKALGLLVVAAGAFSTWYWYKPLPPEAGQAAYSQWDHTGSSDAFWTDSGLLRPSLEELQEASPKSTLTQSNVDSQWNASPSGLLAAPPNKWKLDSLIGKDALPASPYIEIPNQAIVGNLKPWVPTGDEPAAALSVAKHTWPDETKSTDILADAAPSSTQNALNKPALQPPQLLDVGSKRIRSIDDDATPRTQPSTPAQSQFVPEIPRIPEFIRQPRKN